MSFAPDGHTCPDEVTALHVAVLPAVDSAEAQEPLCKWSKPGSVQSASVSLLAPKAAICRGGTSSVEVPAPELSPEQLPLGLQEASGCDESAPPCAEAALQTFLSDWQDQLTEGKRELAKSLSSLKGHRAPPAAAAAGSPTSQTTGQKWLDQLEVLTKNISEELPELSLDPACVKGLVAHMEVVQELVNGLASSSDEWQPGSETAVAASEAASEQTAVATGDDLDATLRIPVRAPCENIPEATCSAAEKSLSPSDESPQFGFTEESVKLASQASGACSTCSYPANTSCHSSTPNSRPSSPTGLRLWPLQSALSTEDLASQPLRRGLSTSPTVDVSGSSGGVERRVWSPIRQVSPARKPGITDIRSILEGSPDRSYGSPMKVRSGVILPPPQEVKDFVHGRKVLEVGQDSANERPAPQPPKVVKASAVLRAQSPPAKAGASAGARSRSPVRGTPVATRYAPPASLVLPSALQCVSPTPQSGCPGGTPVLRKYIATAVPLQRKTVTEASTEPHVRVRVVSESRHSSPTRARVPAVRKLT
mmetsp:Transcript_38637/g.70302  ORF Transcript_38637/g.70302 Transcript_38637/m.70302 type:complete len:537 (-) Transcript_38637:35-1645(-)